MEAYILKHLTCASEYDEQGNIHKGKGKVVSALNQAACYKDILVSGGITPHILNLNNR